MNKTEEKTVVEFGPVFTKEIKKLCKRVNIPVPKLVKKIVWREIARLNEQLNSGQYDCLQDYL